MVAVTGWRAFLTASEARGPRPWPTLFAALTALGIVGPLLALFVFRDSPDRFVAVATFFVALLPLVVLTYGVRPPRRL